jgi:hypothetical protein
MIVMINKNINEAVRIEVNSKDMLQDPNRLI